MAFEDQNGMQEVILHHGCEAAEAGVAEWHRRILRLYRYWQSIHQADGGLPRRQDLDPLDLADILRWVWMVDVHRDPLRFKFRLMGTEHVDAIGFDPTGMWIDDAFPGFLEGPGYPDYVYLAEEAGPSYRKGPAHYHVSDYKIIERVMLPLVGDSGKCEIILAATVYS
ncbi:PAS domain-containing protein [Aestuariispira insulae]|uniref:PAS domain-containing protein n=1 Tax=Aestuariispira insulae TaxID=1461337 RepID=A0A3D9HI02_9PROT|nr:PAS domain-containing protein [Aestuariispira insulae]